MLLFAEMPFLILPTAVLLVITVGRVFTLIAERTIDRSHGKNPSDSDHDSGHGLDTSQVRHA